MVTELGPAFDQVVLLGYPPFLKDVIDTGLSAACAGPTSRPLVTAGEVFSEEWRTLVAERIGGRRAVLRLRLALRHRRRGRARPLRRRSASPSAASWPRAPRPRGTSSARRACPRLPSTTPTPASSRLVDGTLLFSGDNGVPLVRYDIARYGRDPPYDAMLASSGRLGFDPAAALGPGRRAIRALPFVLVFGRSDFTVSYYGANVYPENVTVGLEQPPVQAWVTGKFVMESSGRRRRRLLASPSSWPRRAAGTRGDARRLAPSIEGSCAGSTASSSTTCRRSAAPAGDPAPGRRPGVLPRRRQAPVLPLIRVRSETPDSRENNGR